MSSSAASSLTRIEPRAQTATARASLLLRETPPARTHPPDSQRDASPAARPRGRLRASGPSEARHSRVPPRETEPPAGQCGASRRCSCDAALGGGGALAGDVQGRARGNPRLSGAKERSEGFRPAPVVAEEDTPTDQRAVMPIAAHQSADSYAESVGAVPSTIVLKAVAEIFSGSNASPARFITPLTT